MTYRLPLAAGAALLMLATPAFAQEGNGAKGTSGPAAGDTAKPSTAAGKMDDSSGSKAPDAGKAGAPGTEGKSDAGAGNPTKAPK